MGIHMKKYINTSRRINTKESEEWGFIVINALNVDHRVVFVYLLSAE